MASLKSVDVGCVKIGGGAPVSIQSMCTADPADPRAVASQVMELVQAGCDLVRIAVPTLEHIDAVREVRRLTPGVPLIADVHFDHRVAVRLCGVVDKIRLNPGTMRKPEAMREVARALIDTKTPIRIGTNSGSLPDDLRGPGTDPASALVEAASRWIDGLQDLGVQDIVVSVKSSSPEETIRAYELAAARFDFPLHVGVTEAGTAWSGSIRSATVMGALLARGIGDTIRVSLAGPPVPEVRAAAEILAALGMRSPGLQVRACPGCGRARMDTGAVAAEVERELAGVRGPSAVVAVMGCEVNGPGEAAGARWALVGTKAGAAFYRDGTMVENGPVAQEVMKLVGEVRAGLAETGSRTE